MYQSVKKDHRAIASVFSKRFSKFRFFWAVKICTHQENEVVEGFAESSVDAEVVEEAHVKQQVVLPLIGIESCYKKWQFYAFTVEKTICQVMKWIRKSDFHLYTSVPVG